MFSAIRRTLVGLGSSSEAGESQSLSSSAVFSFTMLILIILGVAHEYYFVASTILLPQSLDLGDAHLSTPTGTPKIPLTGNQGDSVGTEHSPTPQTPVQTQASETAEGNTSTVSPVLLFLVSITLVSFIVRVYKFCSSSSRSDRDRVNQRSGNSAGVNQFLSQLSRLENLGMSGVSNRRTALRMMNRDFTADDYEMLSRLDEGHDQHLGLEEGQIARYPVHTFDQNPSEDDFLSKKEMFRCAICLGPFEKGEILRTVVCMHQFHADCIDSWLRKKGECPVCKINL